jgi:hypothetical protein
MHPTSIAIQPGDRLRLCLAGADFPEIWPTPKPFKMRVYRGRTKGSVIDLPMVPPPSEATVTPNLGPARVDLAPLGLMDSRESHVVHQHLDARVLSFETKRSDASRIDGQATLTTEHHAIVSTDADRPWTTNLRTETTFVLRRPLSSVMTIVKTLVTHFSIQVSAEIDLDGQPFFRKRWHKDVNDWWASEDQHPPGFGIG